MKIKVTITGVDDWSRVLLTTEKGTTLCDTNCHDIEAIRQDVTLGDWHTISGDFGEPDYRISSDIELDLSA